MEEEAQEADKDQCSCCFSKVYKNGGKATFGPITTRQSILEFFRQARGLYAAALGIEILCITAAEIGENTGLYILGFNHMGILIAYTMGYGLASLTTFVTILGRYKYGSGDKIDSCCYALDQGDNSKGFFSTVMITFRNFGLGLKKMKDLPKQPNLREILKTSIITLIAAETACIVTAETVDLVFFKQTIYISIPLALLAGAFTVATFEAYRRLKDSKAHVYKISFK
jgi:hypothetical protein